MLLLSLPGATVSLAAELWVSGATVSITPKLPVGLSGQRHARVAETVESEVTATALALESRQGDRVLAQAIMVSCDLVAIRTGVLEMVRKRIESRLKDFDSRKLFLSATHTHTAPVMSEDTYILPEGVLLPADYVEFLSDQVADAAVKAWKSRKPGSVGWGLGHAVIAQNRRMVYADGSAVMYGKVQGDDFRRIEGYEDQGVEVLFFWNPDGKLIATVVNLACPSQQVENRRAVNADFWHETREALRKRHGEDLTVVAWTGASGDQSPHLRFHRKAAEERMRKLRGLTHLEEVTRRLVQAWEEAYAGARQEKHSDVAMVHHVHDIQLPVRLVTKEEYENAKAKLTEFAATDARHNWSAKWHGGAIDRYEQQLAGTVEPYKMELHAMRLGDVAIATNPFELFTDFGIQMKARSKALQTFVVQLAGPGSYLPTQIAFEGGGYSAVVESSLVGPEGGQLLVEHTVALINSLWPDS